MTMADYIWERLTVSADGTIALPANWLGYIGVADGQCGAVHAACCADHGVATHGSLALFSGLSDEWAAAASADLAAEGKPPVESIQIGADGSARLSAALLLHLGIEPNAGGIVYAYHSDHPADGTTRSGAMLYGEWAIDSLFPRPLWENGKLVEFVPLAYAYCAKLWRRQRPDTMGHAPGGDGNGTLGCRTCGIDINMDDAGKPCPGPPALGWAERCFGPGTFVGGVPYAA